MRRICLLILIISLLFLHGCVEDSANGLRPPEFTPREIIYRTMIVERQNITDSVTIRGRVVPLRREELSFRNVTGYLKEFLVSAGDQVQKGQPLVVLESKELENQLRDLDLALQRAQIQYRRELSEFQMDGRNADALEISRLNLKAAQYRFDRVMKRYDNLTLVAPFSGTVDYTSGMPGRQIGPGTIVIQLSDVSGKLVSIPSDNLGLLVVGSRLFFRVTPDTYAGEVSHIDPVTQSIIIKPLVPFDKPLASMAVVEVILNQKEDVIVVPSTAVYEVAGKHYVQVLESGIRSERVVRLGLITPSHVEVTVGLIEGEQLILSMH